ncbi:hypothetical protein [Mycobacteroides abscessus]|uniref:hypothetical protein n=1 Tax=Mycobacteroides abscessus TaxID=36809 RepID=UPI000E6A2F25|nr:hypothetical protein [Mycobacteroides abscessus]RIS51943.1 hypothetical protein D2E46_24095 [Mycobacteroides abscessus]
MMTHPRFAVNRGAAPLPPPLWSEILGPFADRVPFPISCGCSMWRRRGVGPAVYYVGHEGYICMDGRTDADLAAGPSEPVAVPRLMIASTLWWRHVDEVYAAIRAAQVEVMA